MAANFTFPTLTTAVAGYGSTHYTLQADTPSDAFFTTTIGTRRKGGVDIANYNFLGHKSVSFQRGKRPQVGVLYPRGGG